MSNVLPVELSEVADFLAAAPPFNELAGEELAESAASLKVLYHQQGESFDRGSQPAGLRILRSGAVDIRDADGALLDRLGEGESFHIGGLNAEMGDVTASVSEDA
ncbi:MAG: cyclic nucleotide-binding/CBS domain-containing protein, partial [Halieaceae bacterium]|nr:cyclic nucleotide-binding/CBS domain-containing protein [Halieaceae bacterium]